MQVLTGHGQNKYYSKEVIFYKSLSEKKKGDKVMIKKMIDYFISFNSKSNY